MRKTVLSLLMVVLTAALFSASFTVCMADETGAKDAKKQEAVKKQKQKAKKQKPEAKRKDAGEDKSKASDGNGVLSGVNRTGKKAMDATHSGIESIKNDMNEGYRNLKSGN